MLRSIVLSASLLVAAPFSLMAATPLGTPDPEDIEYPEGDPPSAREVALGKVLFFDTRLSGNERQSCASCHNPDLGFSDGLANGLGANGNTLSRNAPHLYNLAWSSILMWDGRAATLEEQAAGPITAEAEMNMLSISKLIKRLKNVPYYRTEFQAVYGGITQDGITRALASFQRTLMSINSPFDKYMKGDKHAMSSAAIRGMELYTGKARCTLCHDGPNFTDDSFHNIGVGSGDRGRAAIINDKSLEGAFKTPGLRNALLTAPYMHDGSIPTLEQVVRFYNRGGNSKENISPLIKPLNLTDREVLDLVAFLGALTDPVIVERPKIP